MEWKEEEYQHVNGVLAVLEVRVGVGVGVGVEETEPERERSGQGVTGTEWVEMSRWLERGRARGWSWSGTRSCLWRVSVCLPLRSEIQSLVDVNVNVNVSSL